MWHKFDRPKSIRYPPLKTFFTNIHLLQFITTFQIRDFRWTSDPHPGNYQVSETSPLLQEEHSKLCDSSKRKLQKRKKERYLLIESKLQRCQQKSKSFYTKKYKCGISRKKRVNSGCYHRRVYNGQHIIIFLALCHYKVIILIYGPISNPFYWNYLNIV